MDKPKRFINLLETTKKRSKRRKVVAINLLPKRLSNERWGLSNIDELPIWELKTVLGQINKNVRRPFWIHEVFCLKQISGGNKEGSVDSIGRIERGRYIINELIATFQKEKIGSNGGNSDKFKGITIIAGLHKKENFEHIHILHDCTYSSRTCNCAIFNRFNLQSARRFRRRVSSEIQRFTENLATYIIQRSEADHFIYERATGVGRCDYLRHVRGRSIDSSRSEVLDEECDESDFGCSESSRRGHTTNLQDSKSSNISKGEARLREWSAVGKERVVQQQKLIIDRIIEFLKTYMICPPKLCIRTLEWLDDKELRYITDTDPEFKKGMDIFSRLVCTMSIPAIYNMYLGKKIIASNLEQITDFSREEFHSLEDSVVYLEQYLDYQFETRRRADEFLLFLYKLLSGTNGKKNCLVLYGAPDCGKSYLVYSLGCLMMNVGMVTLMNKNNMFWGSDLVNRKLIICDEFNYDPITFTEELKKLFSGEKLDVSAKYKDSQTVLKTPIIIMSNSGGVLPRTPVFQARVNWIQFQIASEMKHIFYKKLHPFCFCLKWMELGDGNFPDMALMNKLQEYC